MEKENNSNKRKKSIFKGLIVVAYSICICLISVFSTILIRNHIYGQPYNYLDDLRNNPATRKITDMEYYDKYFDKFVAFGSASNNPYYIDAILYSNLITKKDKSFLSRQKIQYFNIYLGSKDGVDIILINSLDEPSKVFTFESVLDYKFESIIKEFEEMSGEKLTDAFLIGSNYDSSLRHETLGIIVEFKRIDDNFDEGMYSFDIYFKTTINGKVYAIDKGKHFQDEIISLGGSINER